MTDSRKDTLKLLAIIAAIFITATAIVLTSESRTARASAPSGLQATNATSSTITVGPQSVTTIFGKSQCAARVISTAGQSIMLSYNSAVTPTVAIGHPQGTSTTQTYDSGLTGCGTTTAYALASTTITISEFR